MVKIDCSIIMIGLLMAGLLGSAQRADATIEKMYISNRIKIVRPSAEASKTLAPAPAAGVQTAEGEIPAVPAASLPAAGGEIKNAAPGSGSSAPAVAAGEASGQATPQSSEGAAIQKEFASLIGTKGKYYSRKGRVDPFAPFLHEPEPQVPSEAQSKLNRRVPQTPLEKIDLSELKLTGVLRAENKTRALVQESSGKGYIVDEGTYIGNKGGQISKIFKDRITVSEKALDVFGKVTVLERELKLQP